MQNTVVSSNYPVPRAITFAKFQFRERVDHALAISCEKPSWWKALSPRGTRTVEKVQQRAKKGTIDAPASFLVFLEFSRATAVGLLSPSPTHCLSLRAATHARMREFIDDTSCVCTRARASPREFSASVAATVAVRLYSAWSCRHDAPRPWHGVSVRVPINSSLSHSLSFLFLLEKHEKRETRGSSLDASTPFLEPFNPRGFRSQTHGSAERGWQ